MAPILSMAVGVTPQIIDDPRLQKLLARLNEFEPKGVFHQKNYQSSEEVIAPLDIEQLVAAMEPYQTWIFEEQVRRVEPLPCLLGHSFSAASNGNMKTTCILTSDFIICFTLDRLTCTNGSTL